jgi:hypothetical protein
MRIHLFIKRAVLCLSLVLIASSPALSIHAEDQLVTGAMMLEPAKDLGGVASGAVEDTLKACLARIPLDASAGQRLLAEQSCTSEEGTRKLIADAPKF